MPPNWARPTYTISYEGMNPDVFLLKKNKMQLFFYEVCRYTLTLNKAQQK